MIETTAASARIAGLAERAIHAARAYRAADPDGFDRRSGDPEQWARWARRARVARTIAAALQLPLESVLVTDDPCRDYQTRRGPVPGDLITITDPVTERTWRFIPDVTTPGDGWLLIGSCPRCDASVPVAHVATLADLGEYLDTDGAACHAEEFNQDPAHDPRCTIRETQQSTMDER